MGVASIAVALAGSAALVWHASYSAFSATTVNPTNNWATGTVVLTDDDTNSAMFSVTTLKPGSTGSKCIAVTSTGSLPSTVKLYGTAPATTNGLSTYINLVVTQGTGATSSSCSGFSPLGAGSNVFTGTLASFGVGATSFASGLGTWAPTGSASETRVFMFDYTVDASSPNSTQNGTASISFTWEAQNS